MDTVDVADTDGVAETLLEAERLREEVEGASSPVKMSTSVSPTTVASSSPPGVIASPRTAPTGRLAASSSGSSGTLSGDGFTLGRGVAAHLTSPVSPSTA